MLSYKRIRKISEMFDSSTQLNVNLNDQMLAFDADMDWKYEALNLPASEFSIESQFDFGFEAVDEPLSPQSQIRNHDCMWSGRCTTHPNECLNSRNNCNKKYVNEKLTVTQQQTASTTQSKQQTHNAPLLQKHQSCIQQKKQHNIPAGQSLLRQIKPTAIHVPKITTNDFLNNRDFIVRPDTPLSLDEDVPEFKHNIDLAACTVGSNKMSLIEDSPTEIINYLKEYLEDTNSNRAPKVTGYMSSIRTDPDDLDEIINDISLSDFENGSEDEDETDESDATNDSFNVNDTMVSIPPQQQPNSASIKNTITAYDITQSHHSDHSYTVRSKSRVDVIGLGVQTPSDSEEEIDVVSVGDKNLPTNPSARDRRALQNKITSRMVKTTTTGVHTISRRRISNGSSDDSAYASKGSPEIASPNAGGSPIRLIASRKRVSQISATSAQIPNAKRSKMSKKVSSSPSNGRNVSNIAFATKRNQSVDVSGELETMEKRNLHNDMERQRRIGLKNLFENLKDEIPSLREKERAPKVNILREATILCSKLTQEAREYDRELKRRLKLQQRLKCLREQLAARCMN